MWEMIFQAIGSISSLILLILALIERRDRRGE